MSNFKDTYFFGFEVAKQVALQGNFVKLPDKGKGRQLCYYNGEPLVNNPETLIGVPMDRIFDYFVDTPYRHPTFVNFSGTDFSETLQKETQYNVNHMFEQVNEERERRRQQYKKMIIRQSPNFDDPVKRAFLMTSRHTSVIQYTSKGIARALKKLGYDVKLMIEEDDLQILHKDMRMKAIYEFNPHLTININHMYNEFLNEKTWNIVWWQDPMPDLVKPDALYVRDRDIVFSYCRNFDDFWIRKQITPIFRQEMSIDADIFCPNPNIERKEKVVFIGSTNFKIYPSGSRSLSLKKEMMALLEDGIFFTYDRVRILTEKHGVDYDTGLNLILHDAIRDITVQWLCEESTIDVEIYGRHWEQNEVVLPFFKGEVEHGRDVADIYRSTKYALACQGGNIQTQRLFEAASCGAIPIVYDSRPISPDPLWKNQYLFFKTRDELKQALKKIPENRDGVFDRIKNRFSYDYLAKKIHQTIT